MFWARAYSFRRQKYFVSTKEKTICSGGNEQMGKRLTWRFHWKRVSNSIRYTENDYGEVHIWRGFFATHLFGVVFLGTVILAYKHTNRFSLRWRAICINRRRCDINRLINRSLALRFQDTYTVIWTSVFFYSKLLLANCILLSLSPNGHSMHLCMSNATSWLDLLSCGFVVSFICFVWFDFYNFYYNFYLYLIMICFYFICYNYPNGTKSKNCIFLKVSSGICEVGTINTSSVSESVFKIENTDKSRIRWWSLSNAKYIGVDWRREKEWLGWR